MAARACIVRSEVFFFAYARCRRGSYREGVIFGTFGLRKWRLIMFCEI